MDEGWHDDPLGTPGRQRYRDGNGWTDLVRPRPYADGQSAATDTVAAEPAPNPATGAARAEHGGIDPSTWARAHRSEAEQSSPLVLPSAPPPPLRVTHPAPIVGAGPVEDLDEQQPSGDVALRMLAGLLLVAALVTAALVVARQMRAEQVPVQVVPIGPASTAQPAPTVTPAAAPPAAVPAEQAPAAPAGPIDADPAR